VISSIAGRLARLEHTITKEDDKAIVKASDGLTLKDLSRNLVEAINPDRHLEQAKQQFQTESPTETQLQAAADHLVQEAVKPLHDPKLRELLIDIKKKNEITCKSSTANPISSG
jgi:type I restriction enzyme R subunit